VKGAINFKADGEAYALRFDGAALREIARELQCTPATIGRRLTRAADLRTVFRIGLGRPGMTDAQAGNIISAIGFEVAADLTAAAVRRASL
jgi:hypothetical protein